MMCGLLLPLSSIVNADDDDEENKNMKILQLLRRYYIMNNNTTYYNKTQQIIITTSSWPVNRTLASVDAETAITLSGTLSTTSEGWFA